MPVSGLYSPEVSLTAAPSLSESGSVASTSSAFFSFASLNASSNAALSSGFGTFTVGNALSGSLCSSTTETSVTPISPRSVVTGT